MLRKHAAMRRSANFILKRSQYCSQPQSRTVRIRAQAAGDHDHDECVMFAALLLKHCATASNYEIVHMDAARRNNTVGQHCMTSKQASKQASHGSAASVLQLLVARTQHTPAPLSQAHCMAHGPRANLLQQTYCSLTAKVLVLRFFERRLLHVDTSPTRMGLQRSAAR